MRKKTGYGKRSDEYYNTYRATKSCLLCCWEKVLSTWRSRAQTITVVTAEMVIAEEKYVYYENVSKNTNGSFKQLRVKNKVVPLYPSPEAGDPLSCVHS